MAIQVLDRAVRILDVLYEEGQVPLTVLSTKAGLALSTASRIVNSLVSNGIVEQDSTTRSYRLGTRLFYLGSSVTRPRLQELARPILQRLSEETQEDAGFSTVQGTYAVILDRVEGPQPLKIVAEMRQPVPLHCGAFRKVLLAYQNSEWIERSIGSLRIVKFTQRTITSKAALRQEIAEIRACGYALSYGEYLRDSGGIAAPVFGERDELAGALFIWGPYSRLNETTANRYATLVVDAASTLTRLLRGQFPSSREQRPLIGKSQRKG